jgi:hypothetical protein
VFLVCRWLLAAKETGWFLISIIRDHNGELVCMKKKACKFAVCWRLCTIGGCFFKE